MASTMKDFTVIQMLGKGSYGSVYKCLRKSDGKHYAVKEVNVRKLSPREREDAVNEIRILASVSHENVIRYCDAFAEGNNLYIVMEFAECGDVYRQIKKFKAANKYIKEDTIWSYFLQTMLALKELHSRRVLHRDIKPKNVFLTDKNRIRLGDLGCAKLMKTGLARTQIGTPYYMSPEIWAQRPYDTKSDVWAVGCLVYELCMLNPPFLANDMRGLARKVKTAPAPRISRHYSKELADVVSAMLTKSASSRPDVERLLAMPVVRERMHLLPTPTADGSDRVTSMLATIRVPRDFGVRRAAGDRLNLPVAAYPGEESPAVEAAAGGGGSALPPTTRPGTRSSRTGAAAARVPGATKSNKSKAGLSKPRGGGVSKARALRGGKGVLAAGARANKAPYLSRVPSSGKGVAVKKAAGVGGGAKPRRPASRGRIGSRAPYSRYGRPPASTRPW